MKIIMLPTKTYMYLYVNIIVNIFVEFVWVSVQVKMFYWNIWKDMNNKK